MDVKQHFFSSSCFFCLSKTNYIWCNDCERDFLQEVSRCPMCARYSEKNMVCGLCLAFKPTFNSTETLFSYQYPINQLIIKFKFSNSPELAHIFAEKLSAKLFLKDTKQPDIIVPVPLHSIRQRTRGYNQSLVFAKEISRCIGVETNSSLCRRIINTDPQTSLPMKTRRKNVKGAFEISPGHLPKHIAIVDDVITTGSTISELSRLFRNAGCERIDIWAIART